MDKQHDSINKENNILNDKIYNQLFSVNSDKQELDDEKSKYLKDVIIDMRFMNNCLFGIYLVLLAKTNNTNIPTKALIKDILSKVVSFITL